MEAGAWTAVTVNGAPFATIQETKKAKSLVDEGACGNWKVDTSAPGDYKTRIGWRCNLHVACPVQLQACVIVGGFGFRVRGQHSVAENTRRRANSKLTLAQEALTRDGIASGGKPGGLMASMTKKALEAAQTAGVVAPKRAEGGLEGAQMRNTTARA